MKILGRTYKGECLQLSIPLGVKRNILRRLKTTGQKVSALYWLEFWHDALDRAIVINSNNRKPVQELRKVEAEYAAMIEDLREALKRSSLKALQPKP